MRNLVVPVLLVVAGAALGAGVVALTTNGSRTAEPAPRPTVTVTASPSQSPGGTALTVTVPPSCLAAADLAEQGYALVQDGVDALAVLDATKVGRLLARAQELQPEASRLTRQCREEADVSGSGATP